MPNPACDIARSDYLVDRLRSLSPLGGAHLQRPMNGSRGYLDVKGIDAQPLCTQLFMRAG
jgi:hypothetical protein